MSAREAKNPATQQFTKIDDILNVGSNVDINVDVNKDKEELKDLKVKPYYNEETNTNTNVDSNSEVDRMAALKAKMQASRKKDSNKQVTVYLTPKNYKRFNQLKEKGQKSELINQLLDMYFEE